MGGKLWTTPVEKYVENVENPMFSTVIGLSALWMDRWKTLHTPMHNPGYRVSPSDYVTVCIQKIPEKMAPSVGICRSLPGVGWGSDVPPSDKLCEKPPKCLSLLPFPAGVSISPFGKY